MHVELAAVVYASLVAYVVIDIAKWRRHPVVWLSGLVTIAVGGY